MTTSIPYREWSDDAKERKNAAQRKWNAENRDVLRAAYKKHNRKRRDYKLQWMYGINKAQYDAMWEAQAGLCAICDGPGGPGAKWKPGVPLVPNLQVDHCHATGRVRGLLCHPCNRAIGLLKDDPEILRRASAYLNDGTASPR